MSACPVCLEASPIPHPACCRRAFGTESVPSLPVTIDHIEEMALETVNRRLSVPGVQRKLSLSCLPGGPGRLTVVGALGGTHILKPPTSEYPGMPELEHWTMRLAGRCGLLAAESALVPLASGEPAFVVRRFDRDGNRRISVEDLCQLSLQPTADKYRSSLERVGALVRRHASVPGRDALRVFETSVFCFLVGNSDMHLKNWSLVRDGALVTLSPAYDLLPTRLLLDDPEESALPINGRKAKLDRRDFLALADHLRIPPKVSARTLDRLATDLPRALDELPSPWVAPEQARRLRDHVARMSRRLVPS